MVEKETCRINPISTGFLPRLRRIAIIKRFANIISSVEVKRSVKNADTSDAVCNRDTESQN